MTTISLTKQGKTVKSGFGGAPTSRGLDYAAWTGKRTDFPRIVAVRALPQVDRFEIKLASRRTIALEFGPVERTLNLKFGLTSIPENEEVAEFVVDVRDANIRGRSQRPNGGGPGPPAGALYSSERTTHSANRTLDIQGSPTMMGGANAKVPCRPNTSSLVAHSPPTASTIGPPVRSGREPTQPKVRPASPCEWPSSMCR